jgi:hypothetical protein
MTMYINLDTKQILPDQIAENAIDNPEMLQELLNGIGPQTQKSARRENCSQALMYMAEMWPEILLPHWDYFINLFGTSNGFSKYVAIYMIASLVKADPSGRFAMNLNDYFKMLDDDSVMVASHTALNAAKIALACPALQSEIIRRLINVDQTHQDSGHLALIKAYILESLDALYLTSDLKSEISNFVIAQLQSESPKTRKLAKAFQAKWEA